MAEDDIEDPPVSLRPVYLELLEEEDLSELEELMVPEDMRSPKDTRKRNTLPEQQSQHLNKIKTSQYTTGILTTSGWQPINNPLAKAMSITTPHDELPAVQIAETTADDVTKEEGSVMDMTSDREEDEKSPGAKEVDASQAYLQDKYFDHYGYRTYIKSTKEPDSAREAARVAANPKKKDGQTKFRVANKKGLQLALNITAPGVAIAPAPKKFAKPKTLAAPKTPVTGDAPIIAPDSTTSADNDREDDPKTTKSYMIDETGEWELIDGNADSPRTGNKSSSKLVIKIRNIKSKKITKFSFKTIASADIDWNSRAHIQQIIDWRATIFRQNHFIIKKTYTWFTPVEDAWLMLHLRKVRAAIEAGHDVKTPGPTIIMEAFNAFFAGKVFKDEAGNAMAPRPARDAESIRSKVSQRVGKLAEYRKVTAKLLRGKKTGKVYMPVIAEEELRQYQENGTVVVDDPEDANKNAALVFVDEGREYRNLAPKRKREVKDGGEEEAKRVKPTKQEPKETNSGDPRVQTFLGSKKTTAAKYKSAEFIDDESLDEAETPACRAALGGREPKKKDSDKAVTKPGKLQVAGKKEPIASMFWNATK
jgi:hypothetical protein